MIQTKHSTRHLLSRLFVLLLTFTAALTNAFVTRQPFSPQIANKFQVTSGKNDDALNLSARPNQSQRQSQTQTQQSKTTRGDKFRRQRILNPAASTRTKSRDGNNFSMDRFKGLISFGYTADLVTSLTLPPNNQNPNIIEEWISDAERVAFAIWDEKLMEEIKPQMYRLQLITLKFITISLKPHVDVLMWTETETDAQGNENLVFFIESVDFDPKVSLLPGVNFSAESLGIQIDVAGELRVSSDKKGLTGKIGFITSGKLPPPLRILPETALRSAAGVINKQIADFAVRSFQKGARNEFGKFLRKQ